VVSLAPSNADEVPGVASTLGFLKDEVEQAEKPLG